ncbi:hypothetical protein E2C01_004007 [Portunus trituberculatus]|uniref:Uncharacterized protein n=1 Tax=Portunus trituberculatus TaxID=210409 RepID=A0A5B7CQ80_PORTR|nr:hypothetical protein [Portunus trituberculatus]
MGVPYLTPFPCTHHTNTRPRHPPPFNYLRRVPLMDTNRLYTNTPDPRRVHPHTCPTPEPRRPYSILPRPPPPSCVAD